MDFGSPAVRTDAWSPRRCPFPSAGRARERAGVRQRSPETAGGESPRFRRLGDKCQQTKNLYRILGVGSSVRTTWHRTCFQRRARAFFDSDGAPRRPRHHGHQRPATSRDFQPARPAAAGDTRAAFPELRRSFFVIEPLSSSSSSPHSFGPHRGRSCGGGRRVGRSCRRRRYTAATDRGSDRRS